MKAFDTVEHDAVFHALKSFNFGENYIQMVRMLFNKPELFVMNNGYWADPVYPTRGLRQGCCYSPLVFDVVVELLGLVLRQNSKIEGFTIGKSVIKGGQFADDLWTICKATEGSVNEILTELQNFKNYSGLEINAEKSAILRIGPWQDSEAKFYTLKKLFWSPKSIKILGFHIHPDIMVVFHENYFQNEEKVDGILNTWSNRNLTLMGKIVVVNSLVNSLFTHKFVALPTPPEKFFDMYKKKILKFIWNDKPHKVSYRKLVQDYAKLGLRLVDLQTKDLAMKASWVNKFANREEQLNWFYESLPIKDPRIWYCNTDSRDIKRDVKYFEISKEIWRAWSHYHFNSIPETAEEILEMSIWGNSL